MLTGVKECRNDIVIIGGCIFANYKTSKRADVKVPVLLYHNFVTTVPESDPDNFNYINTPESFEENIKTFLDNGYTIISMQDLADCDSGKTELPSKPIIITFDDGYYSNYEYIYPILKKYNVKASIFIVTDKIGKEIFQVYDIGINNFKDLDRNFIKRINIPCEMTGKEIIEEIEN